MASAARSFDVNPERRSPASHLANAMEGRLCGAQDMCSLPGPRDAETVLRRGVVLGICALSAVELGRGFGDLPKAARDRAKPPGTYGHRRDTNRDEQHSESADEKAGPEELKEGPAGSQQCDRRADVGKQRSLVCQRRSVARQVVAEDHSIRIDLSVVHTAHFPVRSHQAIGTR